MSFSVNSRRRIRPPVSSISVHPANTLPLSHERRSRVCGYQVEPSIICPSLITT